ncbi:MAG: RNA methyltransferase [Oscillospiraceae bacterium]|nr:RNA methyltransferase [Oscillospiraceae bacterium]
MKTQKEYISSRKNPLIQQVRRLLSSRKERECAGLFVSDGTKLLEEAIRWDGQLTTVIHTENIAVSLPEDIREVIVPEEIMEYISPMATPQGALFLCRLPEKKEFIPQNGMLILDGIQDPGNLGTILRTADALDVPVVLLPGCADPYSHKVVRASMGAIFRTPVMEADFETVKAACEKADIPLAVTALREDAADIRTAPVSKMAVVIGSEGQGVSKAVMDACTKYLIIPMNPRCESLNAAIAASIVMWQMKNDKEKV